MASAHPRPHGGERDHAWDALEKRLECFQLMVVSDMPRAIAEADGSPQNVEKITATIKSAYEKTKVYIQSMRTTVQATVGPQGDRLFAEVRTRHQEKITQELATTLGITADMLQPSLDLSRCLEDVATRADNTYQKAVADFNESFQAAAAHAAHVAAVARGQGGGTGVPVTPFPAVATAANQQHLQHLHYQQQQLQPMQQLQQQQQHLQQQLQLQQRQKQKQQQQQQKQPQYHQRLPATAANSVVVAAVANRGAGSTSTSRGGTGASAKASGTYSAGGWTGAASGTNGGSGGNSGSGSGGATVGVGDYTGAGGQGVAGDVTGLKRQEGGVSIVARSERLPEEDKHGLLKIPRDLDAVSEEVRSVVNVETLLMEERQLRSSFDSSPGKSTSHEGDQARKESTQQRKQPWFAKNVVDHRSAWCGLRDAGKRAGLDLVLRPRPWGDPLDPLAGGRQAVASDVLRLMSEATQTYLKQFLSELKTVAWQRRGGLSEDILKGLEARMEDPRLPPPAIELRMGLIPRLPREGKEVCDPRQILRRERDEHRKECVEREALWETHALEALIKGDEERKRAARRGSASRDGAQAGGTSAIDAFEAASRSGWLSMEQLAANEFVKRVALEHGVGLSAAMMAQRKRKNSSARKSSEKQQGRKGDGINADNAESTCDPAVSSRPTGAGRDEASDHDQPSQKRRKLEHGEESRKHKSKRAFLASKNEEALDLVRDVRRRMDGGTREEGSGLRDGSGSTKPARKEINNVDLEAYVRATRLTCSVGSRPLLSGIRRRMAAQRFRAVERNSSKPLV